MMRKVNLILSGIALVALPEVALAQRMASRTAPRRDVEKKVSLQGAFGITVPTGQFGRIEDPGPGAMLGLGYSLNDRVALVAKGGYGALNGSTLTDGGTAPDMQLWHYTAGIEGVLLRSSNRQWRLLGDVGVGRMHFDTDPFTVGTVPTTRQFDHAYVATQGGITAQYRPTRRMTVSLGSAGHWVFAKTDDTRFLRDLDATNIRSFNRIVTWPITAGLSVAI